MNEHVGCVCTDTAVFGCEGLVGLYGIQNLKKNKKKTVLAPDLTLNIS